MDTSAGGRARRARRIDGFQHPVCLAILVLITVAQWLRPSPRDVAFFALATTAVAIDWWWRGRRLRGRRRQAQANPAPEKHAQPNPAPPRPYRGRWRLPSRLHFRFLTRLLALVAATALIGLAPRYGLIDMVALSALGLMAAVVGWGRSDNFAPALASLCDARRRPLHRALWAWSLVVLALALWELGSFIAGLASPPGAATPPSISDLLDPLFDRPLARVPLVAGWLAAGWLLLRWSLKAGKGR